MGSPSPSSERCSFHRRRSTVRLSATPDIVRSLCRPRGYRSPVATVGQPPSGRLIDRPVSSVVPPGRTLALVNFRVAAISRPYQHPSGSASGPCGPPVATSSVTVGHHVVLWSLTTYGECAIMHRVGQAPKFAGQVCPMTTTIAAVLRVKALSFSSRWR